MAAGLLGLATAAGIGQCLAGGRAVRRFAEAMPDRPPGSTVPVLLLKPLYGVEPLLEEALATACTQQHQALRIVFGVQDPTDPAIAVVERLRARFPGRDLRLVVDPTPHGMNRKVANLINMLAATPTLGPDEVVVIADSDIHAAPDYLDHVLAALARPGVGLATTLYVGRPAHSGPIGALGATAITHGFLPGALMARAMGRQDCLGATMALRRTTLEGIGGLEALVSHLADDNELGRQVRAQGLAVALAATVPATTVVESALGDLLRHELRWARTIRALVPGAFALSALQYPIAWAILALAVAPGPWTAALFGLAWAARAAASRGIDQSLAGTGAAPAPVWLLPLRDLLSICLVIASYTGSKVVWRGETLRAGVRKGMSPQ